MEKRASLIAPEIQEILRAPDKTIKMQEMFHDMHSFDIFVLCEDLKNTEIAEVIKALGKGVGIELFEQFDEDRQEDIFDCFSKDWMADILEEMAPDERADFVKFLPSKQVEEVLPLVARAERIDIKKLIEYKEGTAGSILTTEYSSLAPDITVNEAIEKVKQQAFDSEIIYYIYIIDSKRQLLGFTTLRDVIVASSNKKIENIMNRNVISANVNDDKEVVAKMLSDYDFLAIPIVDDEKRLIGIVTVDDVVDVVTEEATEDIYKYGAAGEYINYMKSNSFNLARQRTFWLLILIFVGFISAWVLQINSHQLESIVALSFFIPLLLGAGGNAGTQSSTVVIRGLATGEINMGDLTQVVKKEVTVGIIVGSFMSILVALRAYFLNQDPKLGLTVGLAMIATVMLATTLGGMLPILFKRLGWDPALMSGPFITSIVDVVSLLIYFKVAMMVFN